MHICTHKIYTRRAAAQDGRIQRGDVLLGINGQLVMGRAIEEIKPMILGPIGTPIELFIQRGEHHAHRHTRGTRSFLYRTRLLTLFSRLFTLHAFKSRVPKMPRPQNFFIILW